VINLGYNWHMDTPFTMWDWVPWLGGKQFKLEQKVSFNLALSGTWNNGEDVSKVKDDRQNYSIAGSASYNFLQNVNVNMGVSYFISKDKNEVKRNYDAVLVNLDAAVNF